MRWNSLACCFLYSPLALAVQAHGQAPLVHDGYRVQELAVAPSRRFPPLEVTSATAGCDAFPAAPAPAAGKIEVVPLVKDRFFNKFFQGGGRLYRLVTQQQGEPRAVVVHSGTWTLPRLVEALKGQPDTLRRQGDAYLLRVPLLLETGSSLVMRDGDSLRLSRDRGAFIISMGTLYLSKARLEGWDESRGTPVDMADDGGSFEPFVVGWSGARILVSKSTVAGLGFAENLAQGLSLAVGPQGLAGYEMPPPALANIQDSHFEGMYSAIHATATPDLQVCRNQFVGSRLHAIHLDEGSSGLIFRNKVTATRGAYGLYFNKGVSRVRVLENEISENHRSGISISQSTDIVLARNEIRQNFDAVYLQDADQILLVDNHILDNQRHGLSVRNVGRIRLQGDQIGPNRGVGILARSEGGAVNPKPSLSAGVAQHYSRFVDIALAAQSAQAAPVALTGEATLRAPSAAASPPADGGESARLMQAAPTAPSTSAVVADDGGKEAATVAWVPTAQWLEIVGVTLDGNHSSALVIERPYSILLDKVHVMYPGVRRRPAFRGVLNHFESDILKRLTRQRILLVEPVSLAGDRGSRSQGMDKDKQKQKQKQK